MRRALFHGQTLDLDQPFLYMMSNQVAEMMEETYPELVQMGDRIANVIKSEEHRYKQTTEVGRNALGLTRPRLNQNALDAYRRAGLTLSGAGVTTSVLSSFSNNPTFGIWVEVCRALQNDAGLSHMIATRTAGILPGPEVFKIHDTFGLRPDFIEDIVKNYGLTIDWDGYEAEMHRQRTRARASWKGGHKSVANPAYAKLVENYRTEPDFYFSTNAKNRRIEAIVTKDGAVNDLPAGAEGEIVLDRTVFYSESGGQVSDIGTLWNNDHTVQIADVRGAYYPVAGLIAHRIVAKDKLTVGELVAGDADAARREHIKRNHTATHLMHAALRNILGTHVKQAGSLVEPARLRFDFSHFAAIDPAELRDIEQQVNDEILLNSEIQTDITTLDDALASGALAFFGDRYPEQNVRMVTIPDPSAPRGFYSKELCGGTHVKRTGDIGIFKITVEQSAAAGVRRIEAITGAAALADYQRAQQLLRDVSGRLGVTEENLATAIERTEQTQKLLEKQLETMKRKSALSNLDDLVAQARTIKGVKVISAELEGVDRDSMRQLVDSLRQKLGSGVVVLGTVEDGKVALLAGITKDLTSKLHAGKIIQTIAKLVGGSGGGRPDLAEAGGKDTPGLKSALGQVYPVIDQLL